MHTALAKVFHKEDRTFLIQSLNQYQRDRDVNSLVVALKSVLQHIKQERRLSVIMEKSVPHSDQDIFHRAYGRAGIRNPESGAGAGAGAGNGNGTGTGTGT